MFIKPINSNSPIKNSVTFSQWFIPVAPFYRTLALLKHLYQGNYIKLKNGLRIGMAENLQIGYVLKSVEGVETIAVWQPLTFADLNKILTEEGIWMPQ